LLVGLSNLVNKYLTKGRSPRVIVADTSTKVVFFVEHHYSGVPDTLNVFSNELS
jgi:hypothetical protein